MAFASLEYLNCVLDKLEKVRANATPIEQASRVIFESLSNEGYLFVFGSGHSHMLAEEIFYRAGGLARVKPIFDDRLMLHVKASQSTSYERQSGLSKQLLERHRLTSKDVIIIASNSGRNNAIVEMAQLAKEKGAKVIALTSLMHSASQTSRHPSGKRLFEVSDVVLDNFGEIGDACVQVKSGKVAATSTVVGCAILEAIVARVAELGDSKGIRIETFASSNVDGGDSKNQSLIEKYINEVPIL